MKARVLFKRWTHSKKRAYIIQESISGTADFNVSCLLSSPWHLSLSKKRVLTKRNFKYTHISYAQNIHKLEWFGCDIILFVMIYKQMRNDLTKLKKKLIVAREHKLFYSTS